MMESSAEFKLRLSNGDKSRWLAFIDCLSQNQHASVLENCVESFGEEAEACLEKLLDFWDECRDEMDTRGSYIEGDVVVVQLIGFRHLEPSIPLMEALLKACGALDLESNVSLESDYY